jgi:hypothetical protein
MAEIISYKMCAVKVRNAKLRNYLKIRSDSFLVTLLADTRTYIHTRAKRKHNLLAEVQIMCYNWPSTFLLGRLFYYSKQLKITYKRTKNLIKNYFIEYQ